MNTAWEEQTYWGREGDNEHFKEKYGRKEETVYLGNYEYC